MAYRVEFTESAVADLEALTPTLQQRILRKVRWLCTNFDAIAPKALSANLSGLFKLRIGDYRVIYSFDQKTQYITIHKIGHRSEVYDN
jgi:mRNA interferase RelE/StbE